MESVFALVCLCPPPTFQEETMTEFVRIVVPGCPHHLVHRGNRKANVFRDDSDRLVYLRLMRDACKEHRTFIWGYTLMDNHVHHVAVPEHEESLGKTIQAAHGEYSKYFNIKYGLVGHAWQARFKSSPMEWAHCRNAMRYVERNPVRAGLVERAEDYLWSSAAAHCGLRDDLLLSGECPLVLEIANWSAWLSDPDNEAEQEIIRRQTQIGRPLGSNIFLRELEQKTGRKLLPQKRGPKRNPN
jgi:putative transposase